MIDAGSGFVSIGRISRTHGLAGEVVVNADGDLTELPPALELWLVPPPDTARTTTIRSVRPGPGGALVSLQGVEDIGAASGLAGCLLLARETDVPDGWFPEEEPDLVGYSVYDRARGSIGTIGDVIITGANDVWVVDGPFGEVLVPVIDDVVVAIDHQSRRVDVELLDGLIEED